MDEQNSILKKIFSKTVLAVIGLVLMLVVGVIMFMSYLQGPAPTEPIEVDDGEIQTYREVFETPIDPATQPEEHKTVYEKVEDVVRFDAKYPTVLPGGFALIGVDATEGEASPSGDVVDYYGPTITTYRASGDREIQFIQGYADMGFLPLEEEIKITGDVYAREWPETWGPGITVYFEKEEQDPVYQYHVRGMNVDIETLIEVARSIESI